MKHRLERVRELLKRELSEIVAREFDFTAALVTIQSVDVTPDLKKAHVDVSVVGEDKERTAAVAKLNENRAMLQYALSRRVTLKFTPQLHFRLDESIERGVRINQMIDEIDIPEDESDEN